MDPFYAFLSFTFLLVLEYLASQNWLSAYYLAGIPVYQRADLITTNEDDTALAARLNSAMQGSPLHPSIQFKPIRPGMIAIREALFEPRRGVRYLPIMHCSLRHDQPNRRFTIHGYVNWSVLGALAYLAYRAAVDRTFIPVAILIVLVLGISYSLQSAATGKIAEVIQGRE